MPRSHGRTGRPWLRARKAIIEAYDLCWICNQPVDKNLPGRHPRGPSADHVIPLSQGGDPLDISYLRLAHTGCNSRRGAGRPVAPPTRPQSCDW